MMTQTTVVKSVSQAKTCFSCPHFNDFHEPQYIEIDSLTISNPQYQKGWCELFNRQAWENHEETPDCINSSTSEWNKPNQVRRFLASKSIFSHELQDNLALFPNVNFEELEAFPTEVIELDRDGYPMEETEPTGYFSPNFTTSSDEPF